MSQLRLDNHLVTLVLGALLRQLFTFGVGFSLKECKR